MAEGTNVETGKVDTDITAGLDTAFEIVWRRFKNTRRGRRLQQVKIAARYFFLAGILFITKEPDDYRRTIEGRHGGNEG